MHCAGSTNVQIASGIGYEYRSYIQPIPLFCGATVPSFKRFIDWPNSVLSNLTIIGLRQISLEKRPLSFNFVRFSVAHQPYENYSWMELVPHHWQT